MSYGKKIKFDVIRELAFGDISATYAAVGGVTTKNARAIKLTNNTDQTVYFTDDNSEDQLKLPPNSFQLWDITANKPTSEGAQFFGVGVQSYCRHITALAPSSGYVSIECLIVAGGN